MEPQRIFTEDSFCCMRIQWNRSYGIVFLSIIIFVYGEKDRLAPIRCEVIFIELMKAL